MADERSTIDTIIGIDFGTTKSVAAVMQDGRPVVIPCQEGNSSIPSLVSINKDHDILVGTRARSQSVFNPKNTIVSIKRYLGRSSVWYRHSGGSTHP
jgi:molecular chaperone DnaK